MTLDLIKVDLEYAKDKKLKREDVEALLDWANKQPHLPTINELQAILFLQSCYYRNEAAKATIDAFFTIRTLCPDMFAHRDPRVAPVKNTMEVSLILPLPVKTPEDYTIFYFRLLDTAPDKFVFGDQYRLFDIISMLHLYQHGTSPGHLILFDLEGMSFGHLARFGPFTMKKVLLYLQDALPVRLKGLHYVNIVPFMDKVLALMKPFMKKELMDVLYLHNTVDDLVKHIPRECLIEEYGGKSGSIDELTKQMNSQLLNNVALFEWEEEQKVDESKRPGKPKNAEDIFGVEGTFKKIEID